MLWGKNLADFVWFYAKMADLKKRPVGEKFRVLHKNRTHTETGPNSFHIFDNKENLRAICWPSVHPIFSKWFRLSYLCYFLDRKWIWCIFEGKKIRDFLLIIYLFVIAFAVSYFIPLNTEFWSCPYVHWETKKNPCPNISADFAKVHAQFWCVSGF